MTERMTEGRWREIRDSQRREYNRMIAETDPPSWEYDAIEDLAAEAERALAELAAAKAENERLAAWLTHIKSTGDEFGFIAEEALDGTPFTPEPAP